MSLIQRQDALVAKLEPTYVRYCQRGSGGFYQDEIATRSRAKRLHREELVAAGYTNQQAMESAEQCDQVAFRNMDHKSYVKQMGGAA